MASEMWFIHNKIIRERTLSRVDLLLRFIELLISWTLLMLDMRFSHGVSHIAFDPL